MVVFGVHVLRERVILGLECFANLFQLLRLLGELVSGILKLNLRRCQFFGHFYVRNYRFTHHLDLLLCIIESGPGLVERRFGVLEFVLGPAKIIVLSLKIALHRFKTLLVAFGRLLGSFHCLDGLGLHLIHVLNFFLGPAKIIVLSLKIALRRVKALIHLLRFEGDIDRVLAQATNHTS